MYRPLAAGIALFALHSVFAPVSDADHAPVLYPDGTIVHGDWGLYRPGHMPLRYQYYAPSPQYEYFYASSPVVFYGARRNHSHAVYNGPDPKGLIPEDEVKRFYPRGDCGFYPSNKEDPGAYTRRENENGPTQPAERYFKEWGSASQPPKEYNDPTIYPKWDMPDNVYVPAPSVPVAPPKN
jgi:hypothetical protein